MKFSEQIKKKAITFSYDDGVTQDIRLIELLNRYGLKCTFNLNSQTLGTPKILHRSGKRISHYKLSPSDVKFVYENHEVAAHTLDHPMLPTLEDAEVIRQVEQDRLNLSEMVGYEVLGMAYPGGGVNHDERVAKLVEESTGIRYARTIISSYSFEPQADLFRFNPSVYHLEFDRMMELGEKFLTLQTETPKVFYIWGHSYEADYTPDFWVRLEEFFKLISGQEDIFYGTNAEILL